MIPCADPRAGYLVHKDEIDEAIGSVLSGGRYILGENVSAFEEEFARYIGVAHGVGVANGTDALHLALRACGVGAGDEVITVAHTAVATVAAVEMTGARAVLVDIDPGTFTLDPALVERRLTPRTKAIIPVHLYGHPVDMGPLLDIARARGVRIVEDCAQAHGAKYRGRCVGSLGDIAAFSFYPTKNLGALGDAGLIATNDQDLADRVRLLREYGWSERYQSSIPGWNSRLDEIQAAVLRVKLRHLDEDNDRRAHIAAMYAVGLADTDLVLPSVVVGDRHVFHLYVVRSRDRDALREHLLRQDVSSLIHYPVPVHLQAAYRGRSEPPGSLPVTETVAREVLSLPMFPELTDDQVDRVVEVAQAREAVG